MKSILDKVPPATIDNEMFKVEPSKESSIALQHEEKGEQEGTCRIVAEVPRSIKIQMRERLYKNPDETERTILLKALRAIGFTIGDEHLIDQRKIKNRV
ncbi:MAG: hypothetical protein ACOH2E_08600 [Candidatus Paracaedibacter sp.]